jgi:hypothetical protein
LRPPLLAIVSRASLDSRLRGKDTGMQDAWYLCRYLCPYGGKAVADPCSGNTSGRHRFLPSLSKAPHTTAGRIARTRRKTYATSKGSNRNAQGFLCCPARPIVLRIFYTSAVKLTSVEREALVARTVPSPASVPCVYIFARYGIMRTRRFVRRPISCTIPPTNPRQRLWHTSCMNFSHIGCALLMRIPPMQHPE